MKELLQNIRNGDFATLFDKLNEFLDIKLLMVGKTELTIGLFLGLTISIVLVFIVSELARRFLANKILARYKIELGIRQSIAAFLSIC